MNDSSLIELILQYQGIEYAVCDAERHVIEHSRGLVAATSVPAAQSLSLRGQQLEDLFDELKGAEAALRKVADRELPLFRIDNTYRERPDSKPCYLTFTLWPHPVGLLLIVADTTYAGQLVQRLMQERNEVTLLQGQLKEANRKLEYLFRHFVSANVVEHVMAQRELPHLGGERRTVSLLFADIRGYTSISETLQPELVMDLLNRHFATIGRIVVGQGGTINQYAGDMLMAVFNAPQDQPDHALRAVKAALEIQHFLRVGAELLNVFDKPQATDYLIPMVAQFGVGVNTGLAVVGYLGFEDRFDYTVIGDTTNIGARLSSVAQAGQVLIGPQTYEAVHPHIPTRPVGPLQLKGRMEAVMVYEALEH